MISQTHIRIAVVDDHPLIQQGVISILKEHRNWEVCGVARGYSGATETIRSQSPDVAIVDLSLDEGSGIELIKWIAAESPKTKTVVSSVHDELIYGRLALNAGAMGYVHKHESPETLIAAIETVLSGTVFVSEAVTQQLINDARTQETAKCPDDVLSKRELDVFRMIGRGMESRAIATEMEVSQKTVDSYRERIKQKLGLPNATRLVHFATLWSQV